MIRPYRYLLLLVLCMLLVNPLYAAEFELTMQTTLPEQNVNNIILRDWVKEVETLSNGRVSIKLVTNSAITRIEGAYKALQSGAVDITMFSPTFTPAELSYSNGITFPCVSKNAIHGTNIVWALYEEQEKMRNELNKIELLTMWATDRDAFISIKTPILSPNDLKGKRFLVMSPGVLPDSVNALGGSAVQVGVSDIYIGLQRGMGEVVNMAVPTIRALKLEEVAKHIVVFPLSTNVNYLGMNKELFQSLPKDIQDIFKSTASKKLAMTLATFLKEGADKDLEKCKVEGINVVTLTPEQEAVMQEAFIKHSLDSIRKTYDKTPLKGDIDNWYEVVKATALRTPDTF